MTFRKTALLFGAAITHALSLSAQQGPIHTPQVNSTYYVGQVAGFYPTIQKAVTAACATSGARVVVPAGATPADTIAAAAGCSTVGVIDERPLPSVTYSWTGSGPYTAVSGPSGNVLSALQNRIYIQPNAGTAAVAGPGGPTNNAVTPLLQGIGNTDLFASGGGNNGIANFFAAYATGNAEVPAGSTDTEASNPSIPSGASLVDRRNNAYSVTFHNPGNASVMCGAIGVFVGLADCQHTVFDLNSSSEGAHVTHLFAAGAGYALGNNGTSAQGSSLVQEQVSQDDFWGRGIKEHKAFVINSNAIGDTTGIAHFQKCAGGQGDASAEGCVGYGMHVNEFVSYFQGTIASGGAAGSTLLTTAFTSGQNNFTDGSYLLRTSGPSLAGTVVDFAYPMGFVSYDLSGITMPVSTAWGTLAGATNASANGRYQIPVSQTINVTLGTSPASPGAYVVGNNACLAQRFVESNVPITAVGTPSGGVQSVTFSTRYGWNAGALLMQGGMCGQYGVGTGRSWQPATAAIGSFTATQVVVSGCLGGDCTQSGAGKISDMLSSEVANVGQGITFYQGAEIIGTSKGTPNTVQLAGNTANWTNGDTIIDPHPLAVNISGMYIHFGQTTPCNDLCAGGFAVINDGPASQPRLYDAVLHGPVNNVWEETNDGNVAGTYNNLIFAGTIPQIAVINTNRAPDQDYSLHAGFANKIVNLSLASGSGYRFTVGANYTQLQAANVPPVPTALAQFPVATGLGLSGVVDYTNVLMSGDATMDQTGHVTFAATAVTPGSYTCGNFTVNTKGLLTAAASGSCSGSGSGFPITLGSTSITSGSTTTTIAGLTLTSPALTGVPTAPTAPVGTNTTQLATTAFVLANGGSGTGTVTHTGALTALSIMLGNGSADSKVDTVATTDGAGNMTAASYSTSGATPGKMSLVAGTGSIPILLANSAGFAAPATGGTPFLYKLPATAVVGLLHAAAPATADGVNESAITSSLVAIADLSATGTASATTGLRGDNTWATLPATLSAVSHQFLTSFTSSTGAFTQAAIGLTDLPSLSANTVLGALTATTPSGLAVPSCSGASNALIWTSGTGFGCNTISSSGTVTHTGSLTALHLMLGNGTADSKVDSVALSDGAGNLTVASISTTGTTQGFDAFAVANTAISATLPTSYVGIIGPTGGSPTYFLQLPSANPAGQVMSFAAPSPVNGVSQAVGTWALLPSTLSAVSNQFLTSYTASTGVYTQAQPTFANLAAGTVAAKAIFPGGDLFNGGVNVQSGTSYAFVAADENKLVTFNNASATAVTLSQATTAGFTVGAVFDIYNIGAGTVTITPATSTINGSATLVLNQGQGAKIVSDGTNYSAKVSASPSGSGTVTNVATSGPITGGPITSTGTIGCATCVTSAASLTNKGVMIGGGSQASSTISFPDPKVIPAANCVSSTAGSGWNTTLTPSCIAGTNNLGGSLPFVDTSTAQFEYEIPGDWDTTQQPFWNLFFNSGTNTTGTVIFNVATACTKSDGSVTSDPAFTTADALATKTMAAATRAWSTTIQATQVTSGNNCVPGGTMTVKITRATDTAASAVNVTKATITFPRLLTVQAN